MNRVTFSLVIWLFFIQLNGQSITIKDINFKEDFHCVRLDNSTFRVIYKISKKDAKQSFFRKIDFDTLLHTKDTTLIAFGGEYQMLASSNSVTYTTSLFGSVMNRTLIFHTINNLKETQDSFILKTLTPWNKKMQYHLYASEDPNHFYFMYQLDKHSWEVRLINIDGTKIWNRIYRNTKQQLDILEFLPYTNKLILVVQEDSKKRKYTKLVVLNSKNGADLNTITLSSKAERVTVDNLFSTDSTLYLTGRRFPDSKIDESEIGEPYVKYMSPGENNLSEFKAALPIDKKILWMDAVHGENNELYLVGESFKSESYDAYAAKALGSKLLTLGTVSVTWCELKFMDIAIAKVDNQSLSSPRLLKVAPRKVSIGVFLKSYPFAKYALKTGQVRYFGQSNNGKIYVLSENELNVLNLKSGTQSTIGKISSSSTTPILVFVSDSYGLYYTKELGANVLSFNLINYGN